MLRNVLHAVSPFVGSAPVMIVFLGVKAREHENGPMLNNSSLIMHRELHLSFHGVYRHCVDDHLGAFVGDNDRHLETIIVQVQHSY